MPTRSLGQLTLDLIAKVGNFEGGLAKADRLAKQRFKNIERNANKLAKGIATIGVAAAGAAAVVINATIKQENAVRQLEARLKSTGGIAGKTSDELQSLASGLQRVTTFGDESIIEMEALLLTFTNIRGEIFDRTLPAVIDMSVAMGTDLKSSAIQLGKALNDPVLGISALSRSGIQFTEDQKKVIKALVDSGRTAEAQTIILKELETQFGGAAAAAADTLGGSLQQLRNAFGDLLEAPGGLDDAKEAVQELTTFLQDPKTIEAANKLTTGLIEGFQGVVNVLRETVQLTEFLTNAGVALFQGAAADDIVRLEEQADEVRKLLDDDSLFGKVSRVRFFGKGGAVEYYDEEELKSELLKLESSIADFYTAQEIKGRDLLGLDKSGENAAAPVVETIADTQIIPDIPNDKVDKALDGLQQQVDLLGKSKIQQELYKLETEGATDAQLALARAALETIDVFETEAEAQKAINEELANINSQAKAIEEAMRTEEQVIEDSYQRRREIVLRNMEITGQAQTELLAKLEQDREDQLAAIEEERDMKRLEAQAKVLEGTEMLFDSLADIAREYAGEQSTIYKALFAVEKAAAIARSIVAIQTGLAGAAANPFPANIAAIASVAAATAGIIATIQGTNIQGQAGEGMDYVPHTGSYLLNRGEKVTTQETSTKLDKTLSEIQGQLANNSSNVDSGVNIGNLVIQAPTERAAKNAAGHAARRIAAAVSNSARYT